MEYFFFATKAWCDLEAIEAYVVKRYKKGIVAKVAFDDSNYQEFSDDFKLQETIEKDGKFQAYGADGHFYNIALNGATKGKKYSKFIPMLICLQQYQMFKSYHSDMKFKEQALKNSVQKAFRGMLGFEKSLYVNQDNGFVMPYRLKKSSKKNQPLIVYFAGVETIGHDNIRPLIEFLTYTGGKKINKFDCNILIPQSIRAWENGDTENILRNKYTDNTALLIKQLLEKYDIDSNRIYVYGMSYGGGCVWNALLNSPNLYAAAVETVGEYMNYKTLTDSDFEAISKTPIWMAHASNDSIVNIASDDYFYEKLKSLGANVKYTRWEEYGHAMAGKFFKREPWVEWLFNQSK